MRSPALLVPILLLLLATVKVRVWVVPMSISPGAAGAVCVTEYCLVASAGMLMADKATSRARKPQRFMLPSRFLTSQFSRQDRSQGRNFAAFSARYNPVHRAFRVSDGTRRRNLRLVV